VIFSVWLAQQRRLHREAAYARRLQQDVDDRTAELAERNRDMELANRQLREASVTDSLTGLGNRRRLRDAMAVLYGSEVLHPERRAGPVARCVLMIVDLDYLKPINDQHGHEGGDAVLIQIADILRRCSVPSTPLCAGAATSLSCFAKMPISRAPASWRNDPFVDLQATVRSR